MSAPWAMAKVLPEDDSTRPAKKRIRCGEDVEIWKGSASYQNLVAFLGALADAVRGRSNSAAQAQAPGGPALQALVGVLDELKGWVAEIPLEDYTNQRFGNRAFRTWHRRLCGRSVEMMRAVLSAGGGDPARGDELAVYLEDAFGNNTRIDYGTGHELHFVLILYALRELGCTQPDEDAALVTTAFLKYIEVMRVLQNHYSMEPAGSKGVWGLDDFHHLTYYWGASQLLDNKEDITSSAAQEVCHRHASEYLYLDCMSWILKNKSGAFQENSPTLASLAGLPWAKICKGMLKMYEGEVLKQWPVVQHLCFGPVFPFPDTKRSAPIASGVARWGGPNAGGVPGGIPVPTPGFAATPFPGRGGRAHPAGAAKPPAGEEEKPRGEGTGDPPPQAQKPE